MFQDAFNCPSPTSKKKDRLKQQEKDEAEARAAKAAKDAKMEEAAYRKEAARAAAEAAEYERMTSVTKVVRTASAPAAGRAYRAVDPVDDMASRQYGARSSLHSLNTSMMTLVWVILLCIMSGGLALRQSQQPAMVNPKV